MHAETQATLVAAIERRFATHGASPQGLWWPNAADLAARYEAMMAPLLAGAERISLLDVGCGVGFLPDWLAVNGLLDRVDYTGLDLSAPILAAARARWPSLRFLRADVLADGVPGSPHDAVLACGLLTCRFTETEAAMRDYAEALLQALWPAAGRCLVFNAMGKHVEWERDDLFHWSADEVMRFCRARLARHVELRAAYGLWECSYHVWRDPRAVTSRLSPCWRDVAA